MTDPALKARYLEVMGINRWLPRGAEPAGEAAAAGAEDAPPAEDATDALPAMAKEVAGCTACALCHGRTQTVFGVGDPRAEWLVVGEGPGEQEDKKGEPFVGPAGRLLDNMLRAAGRARGDRVYIANIVKCRPPGNRNPRPEEADACFPYLKRQLELIRPRLIIAVGKTAAQNLLGTDAPLGRMRGRVYQLPESGIPVIVTYHPAYLLRTPQHKRLAWEDLRLALDVTREAAA
jgi:DNA polymerase